MEDLNLKCSQATGDMKEPSVAIEVTIDPHVSQLQHHSVENRILVSVESSSWAIPIATLLKSDGKIPHICSDYYLTVNHCLKQPTRTTVELKNILRKRIGLKVLSKIN